MDGFDYIVVGGGSAGCVVAARLAQDPSARVLLVEAGGSERTRATTVPNAWPENLGTAAEWGDATVPQAEAGPIVYPRGRTLGGSGAINGMAHIRGNRARLRQLGGYGREGLGVRRPAAVLPADRMLRPDAIRGSAAATVRYEWPRCQRRTGTRSPPRSQQR